MIWERRGRPDTEFCPPPVILGCLVPAPRTIVSRCFMSSLDSIVLHLELLIACSAPSQLDSFVSAGGSTTDLARWP